MTKTAYDYAMQFLEMGIGVIPVRYKDKRPDARLLPDGPDGSPTWEPFTTELPTVDLLNAWFAQRINYGVLAGWQSLAILDFDDLQEYSAWSLWCARQSDQAQDIAQNAFQVQSARGVHVYLRLAIPEKRNRKLGRIDFKVHGYVLGPMSVHPTGAIYRAIRPGFYLPVIGALSDILPAMLLNQHVDLPAGVTMPTPAKISDPWHTVNAPAQAIGMGAIDRIKKRFKLQDFLTSLQCTSGDGRWMMTCCPLHDDQHPSMWVDTREQICGCFSGCTSKPLDVIDLFARLKGFSNRDAIQILSEM